MYGFRRNSPGTRCKYGQPARQPYGLPNGSPLPAFRVLRVWKDKKPSEPSLPQVPPDEEAPQIAGVRHKKSDWQRGRLRDACALGGKACRKSGGCRASSGKGVRTGNLSGSPVRWNATKLQKPPTARDFEGRQIGRAHV